MFHEVFPLLQALDGLLTENYWRNIFNYNWNNGEEYCGYGLFDGKEIVGFVGLIFSDRVIENKTEHFCNMSTVIVKQQYRAYSLFLLQPVLKLKNNTITDLTPSSAVCRLLQRLGFKELDSRLKILIPFKTFKRGREANVSFTQDKELIENTLKGEELKVFQDHLPYKCGHLLTYAGSGHCYVIYTKVKSAQLPYCHIQYISDLTLFSKTSMTIRSEIAKEGKTAFVFVDSRLVKGVKLPFSCVLPFRWPRFYKSSGLKPEQIDNLYSENILLNLSNIPSNRRLRQELLGAVFHPFRRH
jgi:hypothetical protein